MSANPDFYTNMLHERLYLTLRNSEAEIGMRETDSHFPILAQTGVEPKPFFIQNRNIPSGLDKYL
jgi:hypothetical protein